MAPSDAPGAGGLDHRPERELEKRTPPKNGGKSADN